MQSQKTQLGPIEVHQIITNKDAPYIILFHGYGANAFDLMPLSQYLLPSQQVNWLFPQGILDMDFGFGMMGKAWFPIDIAAFERAIATGNYRDLSQSEPAGFVNARAAALAMLQALDVPMGKIVLGGFSQGAMLATDLTLRLPVAPAGLAILSGTLLNAESWTQLAANRKGFSFFQSHGRQDPLLPFAMAEKLNELLRNAGLIGKLHAFSGGHEIPPEVLLQLDDYLENNEQ